MVLRGEAGIEIIYERRGKTKSAGGSKSRGPKRKELAKQAVGVHALEEVSDERRWESLLVSICECLHRATCEGVAQQSRQTAHA